MESNINKLEQEIRKKVPYAPMKHIYFPKANKTLLCIYLEGASQSFRLFDENYGLNYVASINYRINSHSCFISSFETMAELQGIGLGRFLHNMALAHADMLGATSSYGYLSPTSDIKGVSVPEQSYIDKEIEALEQIYTKLGNTLNNQLDGSIKFTSAWNRGDRIKLLSSDQLELLEECINSNKNKGLG